MNVSKVKINEPMEKLISESVNSGLPKVGDIVTGMIVNIGKNEIIMDIPGVTTGVIRGWELVDESGRMENLRLGQEAQATVLDLENEKGMIELSFRVAGHKQAWDNLRQLKDSGAAAKVKAVEANKGGLIVELGKVLGFLPVSQLSADNYPRVEGGNKNKIFERLKEYIGREFNVKVIDIDEAEEKLIVSEKALHAEKQVAALSGYEIGDELTVKITGLVDFGLFVEVPVKYSPNNEPESDSAEHAPPQGSVEGLIHISEIAWQRVDDLRQLFKIGQMVKVKVIDLSDSKISLSLKRLQPDPWQQAAQYYQVGQIVKGKVVKINDFGAFIELEHGIHGLAHVSELSSTAGGPPLEAGLVQDFRIINMEPEAHRLGLSRKLSEEKKKEELAVK